MGILAVDSISSTEVDPWLFRESPSGGEAVGTGCGLPGTQAQLELVLAGGVAVLLNWSGLGYRVKSSARGGKEPQEWPLTGMALWGRWGPRHLVGWSDSGGGGPGPPQLPLHPSIALGMGSGAQGPYLVGLGAPGMGRPMLGVLSPHLPRACATHFPRTGGQGSWPPQGPRVDLNPTGAQCWV